MAEGLWLSLTLQALLNRANSKRIRMTQVFRKELGMTPSAYQKQILGEKA